MHYIISIREKTMNNIFHIPPETTAPFPSEKFVELMDAVVERLSQTKFASISMCSLMDLLVDEHRRIIAAIILNAAEGSVEEAMTLLKNSLHSLAHFAFEAGIQYQIELSDSLGEIDFDALFDAENLLDENKPN